ncbi:MAG: glycosyltransferase family 4 protein [Planctomycetota bacterium]|nr:MAG: glycosyltransferase family 4 protein [Planctomycetota bacterium]REJ93396.1 MAG: glycosyltransferase family 4 protein [Planctomycetota bacterium]REK20773.1 MAG: glycosyltransferase family 4 protein [Planctomycetota bacterium]REK38045.1 MAG: glycosyltransferase family 4 protein [Planctomycetota bacterium]
MKILFVSTMFPDEADPSRGVYNYELCRALARQHDVRVVSPRLWTQAARRRLCGQRIERNETEFGGLICSRPCYWYTPKMLRSRYGAFYWHAIRGDIRRLERDFQPDAVLSYWAHPDGEAALKAARRMNVPHAVIVGGSDVLILPKEPARGEKVKRVLVNSDAVMTVSDGLQRNVIELGAAPESVHTIRQGIDPERFHPNRSRGLRERLNLPDDRPVLLWVGRMVDVKRLDLLVDACDRLRSGGRTFLLCLAGAGPEQAAVRQLVDERQLGDCVRFVGVVGHDDLPDWYRAADATLLSSWSEGLPNVLRESLACGTPFVSTDVGSIREIADPRVSVLVQSGDAAGLAEGIIRLLDGGYRTAAADYVARTWSECAADVARLFQRLRGAPDELHQSHRKSRPVPVPA